MPNYLVITGGSQGIGEETVKVFQKQQWRIINLSRSRCTAPGVINIQVDLSGEGWENEVSASLSKELRNPDKICLVHNAAMFESDTVDHLKAEDLRRILNANVVSAVSLNHLLIPQMPKGSAIIYIGSTLSEQAVPGRASYVISKHALVGLMRATCQDLAEKQIHTCCICPGFVNTSMLTNNVEQSILMNFIEKKVIAKRLIEPSEIADFIYHCAATPLLNGSVLHANLGQVAT